MSKFEAELRLPCKQPYAYISVWVRGETAEEFKTNYLTLTGSTSIEDLTKLHGHAYDVVMGVAKKATPEQLITSELGGKVIDEQKVADSKADMTPAPNVKPWERKKPAAIKAADPNDPFANFK